ncbi:MAG TPA: DUF1593 domain-containing protein [Asticcacaulis sp.]|nr:DUF1593 domain-containing protein [Asticcacaulis sp.]
MRPALPLITLLMITGCAVSEHPKAQASETKRDVQVKIAGPDRPRVIVTSDFPPLNVIPVKACKPTDPKPQCSDPDDVQSMVRFLLYANDFDVEALIASSGTFANVANKQSILDMLDKYDEVDENLRRHDPRYPTAAQLRAVTWQGEDGSIGTADFAGGKYRAIDTLVGSDHDTEASNAIIAAIDKPDPGPVWILAWGGSREAAQAIWKVNHSRSPAEAAAFMSKIRLYIIAKQDYTADWLLDTYPDLFIILSEKNYMGMFWNMPGADTIVSDADWMETHIRQGHGALGAAYPRSGWDPSVPGVWEGDTPAFLYVLSGVRGVSDPEKPDMGSWGGKFVRPDASRNHWFDDPAGAETVYKWRPQVQADFAERTDWMRP